MAQFERHYTVAEAQEEIPWVRSLFEKMHLIVKSVHHEATHPPSAPAPAKPTNGNGKPDHHHPHPDVAALISGLEMDDKRELLKGMITAIIQKGIIIQDIERGLIDFPAWRIDEEVLLCYELSDGDRIQFWHDLDSGFAGRQPLDENFH